ncbi:MAG: hypothetical protein L3K06_03570, partial [Thermoplasmata archaeon]|nr:hypothetical protein [Thermoplasmata archaeon]
TLRPGLSENLSLNLTALPGPTGPSDNGTGGPANPLSDPLVLGLLVGVVVLVLAIVLVGRRGRTGAAAPGTETRDEAVAEGSAGDADAVELAQPPGPDAPSP